MSSRSLVFCFHQVIYTVTNVPICHLARILLTYSLCYLLT
nr:MAG TPA: hypothetical protein [Caudoviricetes sp.]